jgi:hypothetical protein
MHTNVTSLPKKLTVVRAAAIIAVAGGTVFTTVGANSQVLPPAPLHTRPFPQAPRSVDFNGWLAMAYGPEDPHDPFSCGLICYRTCRDCPPRGLDLAAIDRRASA